MPSDRRGICGSVLAAAIACFVCLPAQASIYDMTRLLYEPHPFDAGPGPFGQVVAPDAAPMVSGAGGVSR